MYFRTEISALICLHRAKSCVYFSRNILKFSFLVYLLCNCLLLCSALNITSSLNAAGRSPVNFHGVYQWGIGEMTPEASLITAQLTATNRILPAIPAVYVHTPHSSLDGPDPSGLHAQGLNDVRFIKGQYRNSQNKLTRTDHRSRVPYRDRKSPNDRVGYPNDSLLAEYLLLSFYSKPDWPDGCSEMIDAHYQITSH